MSSEPASGKFDHEEVIVEARDGALWDEGQEAFRHEAGATADLEDSRVGRKPLPSEHVGFLWPEVRDLGLEPTEFAFDVREVLL